MEYVRLYKLKKKLISEYELMKSKLEDIITACYLTRIINSEGEYCPVKGFILVYKPLPIATMEDMLEVLQYANDMAYLRTVKVGGPILEIPRDLGYSNYPDSLNPLGGYMIGKGLIPFRFVYEDYVGYVNQSETIVNHSAKDYSSELGLSFNTASQCTWLGTFQFEGKNYYAVFHDGGYEGGIFNADGTYQQPDTTSYRQSTTVSIGNLTISMPAESVKIFDDKGNVSH